MRKATLSQALEVAAKIAVELQVPERAFLDVARTSYRRFGGKPREGRPSPRDRWSPLVDALGGVGALAEVLDTDRRNLLRWRTCATAPDSQTWKTIRALARRKKVEPPMTEQMIAVLKELKVAEASSLFVWKAHGGSATTLEGARAAADAVRDLFVVSNGPVDRGIGRGLYNELVGAGAKDESVRERIARRGH